MVWIGILRPKLWFRKCVGHNVIQILSYPLSLGAAIHKFVKLPLRTVEGFFLLNVAGSHLSCAVLIQRLESERSHLWPFKGPAIWFQSLLHLLLGPFQCAFASCFSGWSVFHILRRVRFRAAVGFPPFNIDCGDNSIVQSPGPPSNHETYQPARCKEFSFYAIQGFIGLRPVVCLQGSISGEFAPIPRRIEIGSGTASPTKPARFMAFRYGLGSNTSFSASMKSRNISWPQRACRRIYAVRSGNGR
jgi:hypothetical protein